MNKTYDQRLDIITQLKESLKLKFTGLDSTIDKIIEQITPWYVYQIPRKTPLVINIWGITGTGKTELVTDISKGLNLPTSFFDSQEFFSNKSAALKPAALRELNSAKENKIIIIDEFHRLRTLTKNEPSKTEDARAKLWEILAGGIKFGFGFEEMLRDTKTGYQLELSYNDGSHPARMKKIEDFDLKYISERHMNLHRRIFYDQNYPSQEKAEAFLQLYQENKDKPFHEYFMALENFIQGLDKLENISTTNSLIFIMGNLDAAYSGVVDDIETIDADELSEVLAKISSQQCKEALFNLFAPEQVARLGSNHFVMPSIRKSSYQKVINTTVEELIKLYQEKFNIILQVDSSVHEMIYHQLVIPSQGMRNIFSGFNTILDAPISQMLPTLIPYAGIPVNLSFKENSYYFEVGCVLFTKEIDLPRKTGLTSPEFLHRIAIHEAGHALVYYLTRKESPLKVVVETSTGGAAGYVKKKKREFSTKKDLINDVMCSFGGYFAEKVVFGAEDISTGSYRDFRNAVRKVTEMVNALGFGEKISPHSLGSSFESPILRTLEKDKDKEIQRVFERLSQDTEKLLSENIHQLKALASWLETKKQVTHEEMNEFMKKLNKEENKVTLFNLPPLPVEYEIRHMDNKE